MTQSAEAVPPVRAMEGFGSEQVTTPFSYGSVHDTFLRSDTLEQKLKKKYWKTKQTVIQKFGKDQDQFVVAGDADIDTKLEKAYHLQSSCTNLLQAIDAYVHQVKVVSAKESDMGDFLTTWSETEYTNAGEVMQNVGKLQRSDSKNRLNLLPSLMRMRNEFLVFRDSAVSDLDLSIQHLEKARTEYRAALLWMKDVSEKLQNPDYRDQLIKFREAQMTVKETKRRFEKLKVDLGEKIDMVSASRCNLLSRSLPGYQKATLDYLDTAAGGFHQLLVDLRTHHHHQYKVRKLLEVIRDLESEEMPFEEQGLTEDGEFSSINRLDQPRNGSGQFKAAESDESLLDLGNEAAKQKQVDESAESSKSSDEDKATSPDGKGWMKNRKTNGEVPGVPSHSEVSEQAKVNDMPLAGIEAELRALQNEVLQPSSSYNFPLSPVTAQKEQSLGQEEENDKQGGVTKEESIEDLLKLDDSSDSADEASQPNSALEPSGEDDSSVKEKDALVSEWDNFSAFMPATRDDSRSPLAGWEKEFMQDSMLSSLPDALVPEKVQDMPLTVPSSSSADKAEFSSPVASVSADSSCPTKVSSAGNTEAPAKQELSSEQVSKVDELLGLGTSNSAGQSQSQTSSSADQILNEELKALGMSFSSSEAAGRAMSETQLAGAAESKNLPLSELESINPAAFQPQQQQLSTAPPLMMPQGMAPQMFRSPLGTMQAPPVFPVQGPMGFLSMPSRFGMVTPGMPSPSVGGTRTELPPPAGASAAAAAGAAGKGTGESKEKEKSWLNFFAHLDPLASEKA